VVGVLQVSNRAPLVWDEAARVDAGFYLSAAIRGLDPNAVWQWINGQVFYPPVAPGLNGLVLLVTHNTEVAAWLPSLVAYGLSGVLSGRLAGALGGGPIGTWCAALLCWTTPIDARLAGGAFTEPLGACLILVVLLGLVALDQHKGLLLPAVVGIAIAITWFTKYDYGLLAAGTAVPAGMWGLIADRTAVRARSLAMMGTAAGLLGAAWFSVNFGEKLRGATAFIGQAVPGSHAGIDVTYYLRALFQSADVGLTPLIALLLVLGLVTAFGQVSRPLAQAPFIFAVLSILMYSTATIKYPRYLGFVIPVLASLAGLLVGRAAAFVMAKRPGRSGRLALISGGVVAAVVLTLQTFSASGPGTQYWFLIRNPEADQALDFIAKEPDCRNGGLLMLGQTNQVSPAAVHLAWSQALGHPAPPVQVVAESPSAERESSLRDALSGACRVVGVDIHAGSRLDTFELHTIFASQADYVRLAHAFESQQVLTRVANASTQDGLVDVFIWTTSRHPTSIGSG
jgi:hypothetical protein